MVSNLKFSLRSRRGRYLARQSFGREAAKPCGEWEGDAIYSIGARFSRPKTVTYAKTIPPVTRTMCGGIVFASDTLKTCIFHLSYRHYPSR